ncbi:hypothetical protein BKA66DRAFT_447790 [Pyrenochaeta sp. MPI-SDFR-AT-0127]|nr:hypothetical protein BKA66DRAFT_447790 [Pyrenochaeta sp. MPI-SDFR-AT-0127]
MSPQESRIRSGRVRTVVPSYNVKVLTYNAKNNRTDHIDYPAPVPGKHRQDFPSTPNKRLRGSRSNPSSSLTSPVPFSALSVLPTPSTKVAVAVNQPGSSDHESAAADASAESTCIASVPTLFDCFNTHRQPRGHFYSANKLYSTGVWIGYLAPERHSESFRELPSFNDLKTKLEIRVALFPPTVGDTHGQTRDAVCRGCVGPNSTVIALREIQFAQDSKLVIMPLDGDDEAGMFCIMIPQVSDPRLPGLRIYRPYEHLNAGRGDRFCNNIMLLSLQDTSRATGTLDAVRAVLSPVELFKIERRARKRPRLDSGICSALTAPFYIAKEAPLLPSTEGNTRDVNRNRDNSQESVRSKQRWRSGSRQSLPGFELSNQKPSEFDKERIPPKQRPNIPGSTSRDQECHPVSSNVAEEAHLIRNSEGLVHASIPLDLTDEQASRVYIIWSVNVDGLDYEFVHTIDECKSFSGLLGLLHEDAEAISPIATILAATKTWRLTYQLADGTKKAVVTRKGSETAFDRLQVTLAQSSIWMDDSYAKLDVELAALSRPPGPAPQGCSI